MLKQLRKLIYISTVMLSIILYIGITIFIPAGSLQTIRLTQSFALLAVVYLYSALVVSPIASEWPKLSINPYLKRARRALGVSAWYFSLSHIYHAFFKQLGGFTGLTYLSDKYLLAIVCSFTAFMILSFMVMTSFDTMVRILSYPRWKMLHRFVYFAAILIVIHALMLGTHFRDLSSAIPMLFGIAMVLLLVLEARRFDRYVVQKFTQKVLFGPGTTLTIGTIFAFILFLLMPGSKDVTLSVHNQHQQNTSGVVQDSIVNSFPSMQGDRTRRYTASFNHPERIEPNENTTLSFNVYDANTGQPTVLFQRIYEKLIHLIIVDEALQYYSHIHPEQKNNTFSIETSFPKAGIYHLYIDFLPWGAIEQQFGFTVVVGDSTQGQIANQTIDIAPKTIEGYNVALDSIKPLQSASLTKAQEKIVFNLKNDKTGKPISTLKPYLGAFGHLVMINTKTYEYIHAHPVMTATPAPNANGGPTVTFVPMSMYSTVKPGMYRLFVQFNPDNTLITSDFTVEVK